MVVLTLFFKNRNIPNPQTDFALLQKEKGMIGYPQLYIILSLFYHYQKLHLFFIVARHTGESSLVFSSDSGDMDFVASQVIPLSQTSPKMIVVSAYRFVTTN